MSEVESKKVPGKSLLRKIGKVSGIAFLALAVSLCAWYAVFYFSGSNEWEEIYSNNDVKVYSLKSPGSTLKQFKGVSKVKATLGGFVKMMNDPNACGDFCFDGKLIEKQSPTLQYSSYKGHMPAIFQTREQVVLINTEQNAVDNSVRISVHAAPGRVPRDPCCVRITHKSNTWKLTPLANGEVGVEFTFDEDFGGDMPNILINMIMSEYMSEVMLNLQALVDRDAYKNASVDFIKEP